LHREDAQLRLTVGRAAIIKSRADSVEQVACLGAQASVIVRLYRHAGDARDDAVEINRHRRGRPGGAGRLGGGGRLRRVSGLLVARRCFGLAGLRLRRLALHVLDRLARHLRVALVLRLGGGRLACFGDRHLVALGGERVLDVLAQGDRVDVGLAVEGVVELDGRNLRRELAVAQVVEVIARGVPRGVLRVEEADGDGVQLIVRGAPDVDARVVVRARHAEGEEVALRRPDVVANLAAPRIDDLRELAVVEREDEYLAVLVAEGDARAVGGPFGRVPHGVAARGDLLGGLRAVLLHDPDFFLAALVGDEGDARAVGRPARPLVVRAAGVGQVARRAVLDRRGEDVAARAEQGALAFRAERV